MFKNVIRSNLKNVKLFSTINSEVLIVGGGVPGLSLAAALLKTPHLKDSITIIDQPMKLNDDFKYRQNRLPDLRVISLTPASVRFFKSIGLWQHIDERLVKYINSMQVYESKGSGYINLNTNDIRSFASLFDYMPNFIPRPLITQEYVCATIEINHLLHGLNVLLKNRINIVSHSLKYENIEIEQDQEYSRLKLLKEDITYESPLIVASDGAKSVIRNKLGLSTIGYDYNETGLVCTLKGNRIGDTAYQRFMHNGIFALLPMYDDLYSIVCSMPRNLNENLMKLSDEEFITFVNKLLHNPSEIDVSHIDRLLSSNNYSSPPIITEILSKRVEIPLQLQFVNNNISDNVVLIGDAAHAIHPMAGQGMNLGIADSAILSNEIINGILDGRRVNDHRMLREYGFKSQLNYKTMIGTIEGLKLSYKPTDILSTSIRNLGKSILNQSSLVKGSLILAASGNLNLPENYAWDS